MPIFEYKCDDCGTSFEKLVRNGAAVACPSCGQDHLKQQFSTFAAKASDGAQMQMPSGGGCPAGMCRTPNVCGRN